MWDINLELRETKSELCDVNSEFRIVRFKHCNSDCFSQNCECIFHNYEFISCNSVLIVGYKVANYLFYPLVESSIHTTITKQV